MDYTQRMFARLKFLELMSELTLASFEDFFQRVMCARYPDFLDVRTHGNIGDLGADGLTLHGRKLFACYAPETDKSAAEVRAKLVSDLVKAIQKRGDQFDTFVFVHNDRRGMHPEIATQLSEAASSHPRLAFEQMGSRKLWQEVMQLDLVLAEDVLRSQIPVSALVHGVGMDDLAPLLKHLHTQRSAADPLMPLPEVAPDKLDFNGLHGDARTNLLRGMRSSHLVESFYDGFVRTIEHDEVARGFQLYYEQIRQEWTDPEDVLWQLEMYVLGNASPHPRAQRAAWVVLAHFFERCDIFAAPPVGWPQRIGGSS